MISIRTDEEIQIMKEGGKITAGALDAVLKNVKVGVKLSELDKIAEDFILKAGAKPSFKMVEGYKYTTCININEGLVHGIPNDTVVKTGDLVKVDLGAFYKGFHTDLSYTVEVGTNKYTQFLKAGEEAINEAIKQCVAGNHIGDISFAIQKVIEGAGLSISRELIGHGVGKELHEDPEIPGYGVMGRGPLIKKGMVFALEVIYQAGKPDLAFEKDGWTIRTKDRSMAGLFEHTVAITDNKPVVLTLLTA